MSEISPAQLKQAAAYFLERSPTFPPMGEDVADAAPDLQVLRETQNALRAAVTSAGSTFDMAHVVNLLMKTSDGKALQGSPTGPAQDNYRAALIFAGAGLDRGLKLLVEEAVPRLVETDDATDSELSKFAQRRISAKDGGVDPAELVKLLLTRGDRPRDILVNNWIRHLTAESAQSAERVREMCSALGVGDKKLLERISRPSTGPLGTTLRDAFTERNLVAHELDVTRPKEQVRAVLERIRKERRPTRMRDLAVEMLDVTHLVYRDVASRLQAAGVD